MIVKTILKNKALINPPTSKPLTILEANMIIKALITNVNNPNVRILIGKVKSTSNGFIKLFKRPRTRAKIKALQTPATLTPGIK